jgi:hypothetical protein
MLLEQHGSGIHVVKSTGPALSGDARIDHAFIA